MNSAFAGDVGCFDKLSTNGLGVQRKRTIGPLVVADLAAGGYAVPQQTFDLSRVRHRTALGV